MVHGLSHITFIVEDLDRMETFLTTVFDARKVYDSGEETFSLSRERFFLIGEGEGAVWVATMEGESLPTRTYNHVAFKIDDADFDSYRARVERLGLDIRESRPRVEGEGRSIYFHDYDNHMFELHTGTLEERLARYAESRDGEGD
jgi:fosfomycin resistance protein FosX